MKFEIKQAIVEFRSNDEFYELEESGKKPNTVRELTFDEVERALKATHIRILTKNGQTQFERKLTNVSAIPTSIIGLQCSDIRQLVIFSWEHRNDKERHWTADLTDITCVHYAVCIGHSCIHSTVRTFNFGFVCYNLFVHFLNPPYVITHN